MALIDRDLNHRSSTDYVGPVSYSTNFLGSESPLSEGGVWQNHGLDWTNVIKAGGIAYGTQSATNGYDDSYAILAGMGFGPNQRVTCTIHKASGTSNYQETEILLRWVDGPHISYGYECNLAHDGGYAEIIKWPTSGIGHGLPDFTWVSSGNPVSNGVNDGDIFSASIIGSSIVVTLNGNVIATGTDSQFTSGAPGIGFYSEGSPAGNKYGFTSFSAVTL